MKLALGTVQFGQDYGIANVTGRPTLEEIGLILRSAREAGFDTLDTAIAYGASESVLGALGVEGWRVITKLPRLPTGSLNVNQWVVDHVRNSLGRMRIGSLYGLLLHNPMDLLTDRGSELYFALQNLKADGFVKKIGISTYGTQELDLLFNKFDLDLVQAPLNILDRSLVESGWTKKLSESGTEIHTRSVFLQGLLLMPPQKRPVKFNRWTEVWLEWDRWLAETALTPLQACVQYASSIRDVNRIVVGIDSIKHFNQILGATMGRLSSLPNFKPLRDGRLVNPSSWNQL